MLAALGLPAKVLITAFATVAITGSVATGLVSAVGLAPAVAADGREVGFVHLRTSLTPSAVLT